MTPDMQHLIATLVVVFIMGLICYRLGYLNGRRDGRRDQP